MPLDVLNATIGFIGFFLGGVMTSFINREKKSKIKNLLLSKDGVIEKVIVGGVVSVLFYLTASEFLTGPIIPQKIITFLIIIIVFVVLVYLSLNDIKFLNIPYIPTLLLCIFLFLLNLILILFVQKDAIVISNSIFFSPSGNLIAGFFGIVLIGSIVYFSKEKAMGAGDIYLAGIMGLSLGLSKIVVGFYITILTASVYGVLLAIRKKKFSGVELPFVPFIVFGIVLTFLFHQEITIFLSERIFLLN